MFRRQWFRVPSKSCQMQRRSRNTINSGAIRIVDSALALRQQHRLSVGLPGHQVEGGAPCSRMKYRRRSCSTGSLAAEVWVEVHLVGPRKLPARDGTLTCIQGGFDSAPQFVFNLGGGPGFRVHQFGGGRPRRRPREANGDPNQAPQSAGSVLSNLLPLLILFVLPLLSSIFSSSTPAGPSFRFDTPEPPYTMQRTTPRLMVDYYLNPAEVEDYSNRKLKDLDKRAESSYVTNLQYECQREIQTRNRMIDDAQGWFLPDAEKMRAARNFDMRSCRKLDEWGYSRGPY